MKNNFKGFFITGTGTNVGKTIVSSILVHKLNAFYWKPVQCGKDKGLTDSEMVKKTLALDEKRILKEVFLLKSPISPNLAAEEEKKEICLSDFKIDFFKKNFPLIVEGAGGILVPINENEYVVDIIKQIKLPVILVASTKLGTINHTLLSIESLNNRKIEIYGIIFIGDENKGTVRTIENFFQKITQKKISLLARIPFLQTINLETLKQASELISIKNER